MPKLGEKIQVFIFGLSVGLLAACLFFIFKLDDFFRKMDFSALNQKKNTTEEVVTNKKEENVSEKKEKEPVKKADTENYREKKNYEVASGGNFVQDSSAAETENILKEELVSVKNLYVKDISPKEKTSSSDSLIASLAGITNPDDKEFFMIEFRKTPLNSKGYKMTRNRLLIYGYQENADVSVIKYNDTYYLRNNNQIYKLTYSSDFKPLEKSADSDVAGKF